MSEAIKKLLERQSAWQKGRKELSWPEKIRMAEAVRESVVRLRHSASKRTTEKTKDKSGPD